MYVDVTCKVIVCLETLVSLQLLSCKLSWSCDEVEHNVRESQGRQSSNIVNQGSLRQFIRAQWCNQIIALCSPSICKCKNRVHVNGCNYRAQQFCGYTQEYPPPLRHSLCSQAPPHRCGPFWPFSNMRWDICCTNICMHYVCRYVAGHCSSLSLSQYTRNVYTCRQPNEALHTDESKAMYTHGHPSKYMEHNS